MQDTYIFKEIPSQRPNTPLLDRIEVPAQLREVPPDQLVQFARELRAFLLWSVGQTGGHFGAGLGVLELTVALHYVFNTPKDRLVWDVGHQAYPHKILTGRRDRMGSIRRKDGLAGFPKRAESEYDTFGVGHSSTSISAALGMAIAARQQETGRKSIAVIGDGAMTAGMAFEALNHAGHLRADMLVILNDNDMSISRNVGGLSNYFAKLLSSRTYNQVRDSSKKVLQGAPQLMALAKKTEEHFKGMIVPGTLFEELGFNYIGPIDGHDLPLLIETLENIRELDGPQFLHVVTTKGKGFAPAEADPIGYHAINKIEPVPASKPEPVKPVATKQKYANVFGQWLCDAAELDDRVSGITPAMCEGSDLLAFSERFPDRYFDVAIAEQHAVTLAAGMACDGAKPVVAIYSTFLQRGYDQLIHDVAIQNLDVLFAIDRAGLVGEDGPTHAGAFDISYLRCIPNMVLMTPSDENETRQLLHTGLMFKGPAAVRYPRGTGPGADIQKELTPVIIGKGRKIREGSSIAILNFGTLLTPALEAAEKLGATVADMRFVKPLDEALVLELAEQHDLLVTLEENTIAGGAGSAVTEFLNRQEVSMPVLQLGLPDTFIDHGKHEELLKDCGLDAQGLFAAINARMERLQHQRLKAVK
ncbi:1-deoxy-D-xylulose-5-phosphate synthase [Marinobacter salexigens]|uniref:1-deoxy-D-xylulose-5-phosphate synthase n=1 Tax=Marinobacter salexigens TaxID=1925763 RepID=A0ABS6AD16_9GAMM|nr:1-deoxy-D-xylulose-5-phosphate synthase [Marinobacter salexigens]MBU2875999.1 1-deoxy-D-xylulose-5-phosphate synthase [Marinobacter salexigens]